MFTKRLLLLFMICISSQFYMIADDEAPTTNIAAIITDAATITDDIAEIILTCKTEKDPKKIKLLVSRIVKSIANIIEAIIEKRKLKKLSRSISINDFDFSAISSQDLETEIEQYIQTILIKAGLNNEN